MMLVIFILCAILALTAAIMPTSMIKTHSFRNYKNDKNTIFTAAVLPGNPAVTGTLSLGFMNAIELYSNVMLVRFALSWFPQLVTQFPILQPVFTVTEPYLRIFRSQIPPIGGFDISAIPALFCLNILSQTAAAIGAEVPSKLKANDDAEKSHNKRRVYEL
jgi:YggT family protein